MSGARPGAGKGGRRAATGAPDDASAGVPEDLLTAAREAFANVLVAHGEAEEQKVYPRLRRKDAIGAEEQHHGEEEHAEINEALLALMECKGTDTQKFEDAVEKMNEVLQHHLTEEELTILNPAREEVSEKDREALGTAFLEIRGQILDKGVTIADVEKLVKRAHQEGLLPADEEE